MALARFRCLGKDFLQNSFWKASLVCMIDTQESKFCWFGIPPCSIKLGDVIFTSDLSGLDDCPTNLLTLTAQYLSPRGEDMGKPCPVILRSLWGRNRSLAEPCFNLRIFLGSNIQWRRLGLETLTVFPWQQLQWWRSTNHFPPMSLSHSYKLQAIANDEVKSGDVDRPRS